MSFEKLDGAHGPDRPRPATARANSAHGGSGAGPAHGGPGAGSAHGGPGAGSAHGSSGGGRSTRARWTRAALAIVGAGLILWLLRAPLLRPVGTWLHAVDQPVPSDVVVVLGGQSGFRVIKGLELYRGGYGKRLAITSPDAEFPDLEAPPADRWLELLERRGLAADSVDVLSPSFSTFDDGRVTRQYLERTGYRSVLFVTDPYHTRRARWVLRRMLEHAGYRVRVTASDPPWFNPRAWWRDERQLIAVANEYLKLAYYVVHYGPFGPIKGPPAGLHAKEGGR
jgi:uncharacterized SAM-binding protein YcdF (DUF218 family)